MPDTVPPLLSFVQEYEPTHLSNFEITSGNELRLATGFYNFRLAYLNERYEDECTPTTRHYLSKLHQTFYDYIQDYTRLGLGSGYEVNYNLQRLLWAWEAMSDVYMHCMEEKRTFGHAVEAIRYVMLLALRYHLREKRMVWVEEEEYALNDGTDEVIKLVEATGAILGVCTADYVSSVFSHLLV
jgi:hypothetical protein